MNEKIRNDIMNRFRKNPLKWIYLLVGFVAAVVVGSTGYILYVGNNMVAKNAPLIDAAMEIQLEATMGHLWFEEIISGDSSETIEGVLKHLDNADWYTQAMLEGDENLVGEFISLRDPQLRQEIKEICSKLAEFRKITLQRWQARATSGIGSEIDQKYDAIFKDFIEQADMVETDLQQLMKQELKNFRIVQVVLIAICLSVTVAVGIAFSRFVYRQIQDEQKLRAANQQLDATNQQLLANEQQLRAANQQFDAANQQLQAGEQHLKASNQQLQASEQYLKATNQQLQAEIAERKQAEKKLAKTHRKLVDTAREVGKGEVATSVLHNVGNVVNSVNVTAGSIKEKLRNSKVADIAQVTELLKEHTDDLGEFLTNDSRGQKVPLYLEGLSQHLTAEQQNLIEMIDSLTGHVQHITEIISIQQSFHKTTALTEVVSVDELIEDAIAINVAGLGRHDVDLRRHYQKLPAVILDRHKLLQIIINLISNAKYAVSESNQHNKLITLRTRKLEGDQFQIEVCDNGIGIASENITKIFASGFTTRKEGHGYGLHSAALTAKEMDGSLNAHSEGPGKGTTFTLKLPLKPARVKNG